MNNIRRVMTSSGIGSINYLAIDMFGYIYGSKDGREFNVVGQRAVNDASGIFQSRSLGNDNFYMLTNTGIYLSTNLTEWTKIGNGKYSYVINESSNYNYSGATMISIIGHPTLPYSNGVYVVYESPENPKSFESYSLYSSSSSGILSSNLSGSNPIIFDGSNILHTVSQSSIIRGGLYSSEDGSIIPTNINGYIPSIQQGSSLYSLNSKFYIVKTVGSSSYYTLLDLRYLENSQSSGYLHPYSKIISPNDDRSSGYGIYSNMYGYIELIKITATFTEVNNTLPKVDSICSFSASPLNGIYRTVDKGRVSIIEDPVTSQPSMVFGLYGYAGQGLALDKFDRNFWVDLKTGEQGWMKINNPYYAPNSSYNSEYHLLNITKLNKTLEL